MQLAAETRIEIGFEQAGIGAAIFDLEGVPIRVNPAVCSLLGRPKELLVGRHWTAYTHPDETPSWQSLLARVAAGHDTYAVEGRYSAPRWHRCVGIVARHTRPGRVWRTTVFLGAASRHYRSQGDGA